MHNSYSNLPLIVEEKRFVMQVDGRDAFIDFKQFGSELVLIHTEVPAELEGRGVASALVEKTLEYAAENRLMVIPKCTYVIGFLKKHPEWDRVVKGKQAEKN